MAFLIVVRMLAVVLLLIQTPYLAASDRWSQASKQGETSKRRVILLSDIGNEPDDSESFVRFLLYSNQFDPEALVATTSTWQRAKTQPQLMRERVAAYAKVLPNLRRHAPGFPDGDRLMNAIVSGVPAYGMAAVGDGKETEASKRIIAAVDRPDPRPVYVIIWGGAVDLAQVLWTVRATRTPQQVETFLRKLRVYSISDQDDAGPWIRQNFPGLFWIASVHAWGNYLLAAWTGISGDLFLSEKWPWSELISNEWLEKNVRRGPLGTLYPPHLFLMEGDTPSLLWLIENGLNVPDHPEYGGWGGRYVQTYEGAGHRADTQDTFEGPDGRTWTSNQASVFRWREAFQHDLAARIGWTLTSDRRQANHNPELVLNGSRGQSPVVLTARPGQTVRLDASGSRDPDGNGLTYRWWQYLEPSNVPAVIAPKIDLVSSGLASSFVIPSVRAPTTLHVIFEARDSGSPVLTSYRRALINVNP